MTDHEAAPTPAPAGAEVVPAERSVLAPSLLSPPVGPPGGGGPAATGADAEPAAVALLTSACLRTDSSVVSVASAATGAR